MKLLARGLLPEGPILSSLWCLLVSAPLRRCNSYCPAENDLSSSEGPTFLPHVPLPLSDYWEICVDQEIWERWLLLWNRSYVLAKWLYCLLREVLGCHLFMAGSLLCQHQRRVFHLRWDGLCTDTCFMESWLSWGLFCRAWIATLNPRGWQIKSFVIFWARISAFPVNTLLFLFILHSSGSKWAALDKL